MAIISTGLRRVFVSLAVAGMLAGGLNAGDAAAQQNPIGLGSDRASEIERLVRDLFGPIGPRTDALEIMRSRGELDVVPGLIQAQRYLRSGDINDVLQALTGETEINEWADWMLWQEVRPEIIPHEGFDAVKADVMAVMDEDFRVFLQAGVAHDIRLEEIVWGGVVKDGIPALVNAEQIAADKATYLTDDELVFGVTINGDTRAYPFRIMDWHEMFNDVVGGVPVALAYCTLCASGILYDMRVEGYDAPFEFGSSGFLYRSNKLMYDQGTLSLWNQFTGKPVVGPLTGSGIELTALPVAITDWQTWLAKHPDTTVLSLETGYRRDYTPGRPYGSYFNSTELMFPARLPDRTLAAKDYVFALRGDSADEKAWPLSMFDGGAVVNDTAGSGADVVLVGNASTRTVRAFDAGGRDFALTDDPDVVTAEGMDWRVDEDALVADDGTRAERLAGHIAYWFAFNNFLEGKPLAGS